MATDRAGCRSGTVFSGKLSSEVLSSTVAVFSSTRVGPVRSACDIIGLRRIRDCGMTFRDVRNLKKQIRRTALSRRDDQQHKDELSARIVGAFMSLPEYATASSVMFYIDVRSEVRTRQFLPDALHSGKTIVVPWCNDRGELELFRLAGLDELETGRYQIPEPRENLRNLPDKQVSLEEPDVIIVPGIGFDVRGGRVGSGRGYYDKLLKHVRTDTQIIALAFECQMLDEIPVAEHDVLMDKVITEDRIYPGQGR